MTIYLKIEFELGKQNTRVMVGTSLEGCEGVLMTERGQQGARCVAGPWEVVLEPYRVRYVATSLHCWARKGAECAQRFPLCMWELEVQEGHAQGHTAGSDGRWILGRVLFPGGAWEHV